MSTRRRLPDRRSAETFGVNSGALFCACTVGRYADGSVGEIFLSNQKSGSDADIAASSGAVVVSLALQFGCPLDTLRHAMPRDASGNPSGILAAALDAITEQDGAP